MNLEILEIVKEIEEWLMTSSGAMEVGIEDCCHSLKEIAKASS